MNKVPDLERERALNASINDAFFCLEPETCAVDWAGPVEYEGAMQCPSCGDSFDWSAKFAEIVTCRSCQAVSRIGDGTPSLAGQSAKLIASSSGLGMGVTGSFKGVAFTTVGRVRYGYAQGFWDEWCLQTAENELVWLTEDDGNLAHSKSVPLHKALPLEQLSLGRSLFLADHDYLIEEIGKAKCLGTEGQLPFSSIPGDEIDYLSLRAGKTQTATIEIYDDEVHVYQGQRIRLIDLHLLNPVAIDAKGPTEGFTLASTDTSRIGCYACGAPLSAESIESGGACEFCGAKQEQVTPQIDCQHCNTRFGLVAAEFITQAQCPKCFKGVEIETQGTAANLQVFTKPMEAGEVSPEKHLAAIHPFKLGQRAKFDGKEFALTGHLRNETVEEGVSYFSDSFHLLSKDGEVRWLDREDGHYVLSERIGPVPERLLSCVPKSKTTFNGRTYRFFDSGDSSVCSVQGQFTYGAKILDTSSYYDFVAPPHYLSAELTDRELEGFAGRYMPSADIAAAFQMSANSFVEPSIQVPHSLISRVPFRRWPGPSFPFTCSFSWSSCLSLRSRARRWKSPPSSISKTKIRRPSRHPLLK